jgi:hypothetical protein
MHTWARLGAYGAALTAAMATVTPFEITNATADGATTVALQALLRRCDFSSTIFGPQVQRVGLGSGTALIRTSGSTVSAEVHLVDQNQPGTHFDVGLIQAPRPSSATCGPGDPGTAYAGLDTDGAGRGTVTIQEGIQQGATGAWVIVERPNANSQNPAEFYTSEFVAPISAGARS